MSDEKSKKEAVKTDENNCSEQLKEQGIHDTPEINIGEVRNYYINDDGHLVDKLVRGNNKSDYMTVI